MNMFCRLVLFFFLCGTDNLLVSVLHHTDDHQRRDILNLFAPAAPQPDPVQIDI